MCVKYRKQILLGKERGEALRQIFQEVAERYWYRIKDVGTDGDHVHVFVGAAGSVHFHFRVVISGSRFFSWRNC
jgi:REP element-mobilizing transposase RayT